MRPLLVAALGVAAALAHSAAAAPHAETLYARAHGTIAAFAQDGSQIAWFAPSRNSCNTVQVRSLTNGAQVAMPEQGSTPNVTCRWDVVPPVRLALAGGTSTVLWTLRERTPLAFDYLIGAAVDNRKERRFQQLAHTNAGVGLWLGGVSGDGSTLVYGITSVDYVDEAGCLAGTGSCALKLVSGGGVYRVAGRQAPKLIPGTVSAVAVATAAGTVAYVPAGPPANGGRPTASTTLPIQVVDAQTGTAISTVTPAGTPLAIALAPTIVATLERTPLGTRIAWYERATGKPAGSVPVSSNTSPELSASDQLVVYHVGASIRAVDVATHRVRTLATASGDPIGLSIEGGRLAWAENLKTGARIRALWPNGRG